MYQSYQEIMHLLLHASARQTGPRTLTLYGHIVAYDPENHAIKAQIPGLRVDETSPGIVTGWLPLGSSFVGNGYGAQFAPEADASGINSPTPRGTPCEISLNEQDGAAVVTAVRFNDKHKAPFPNIKPGESGFKAKSGSSWFLDAKGDWTLVAVGPDAEIHHTQHETGSNYVLDKTGSWKLEAKGDGATLSQEQTQTGSKIVQNADGSIDITAGEGGGSPPIRVNGKVVYLGDEPGPAVARIGDVVVGTDGTTVIGHIKTGSSKVFAAD